MKKFLFPRICNAYMSYLALLSLACFIPAIFLGDKWELYFLLIASVPLPLILTVTRYSSKSFLLFWIIHIVFPAVCLFVPLTFGYKLTLFAFVLTLSLVSVYEKLKEKYNFEVYSLAYSIFMGLLQFICGMFAMENCIKLILVCIIIYCVLYTTAKGFYNLEIFISENKDLSNFPLKRIKASGIAVNTVFPLSFVLLLAFIPYKTVNYIFNICSEYLYKVFFFLMKILPFKGNGKTLSPEEEISRISQNMGRQEQQMTDFMGIPKTNAFINFLGDFGLFCSYVIVAGLVIFLLRLLWRFIYNAYGKYSATDNTIDIRESLEKVYVKDKVKNKITLKQRFSSENKIREKFRKRVIKENKNKSITGKVPTELVSDLSLAQNYETVRYGKQL